MKATDTPTVPPFKRHKGTNQGYVLIDGRRHYLGRYDHPQTKARYDQLIAEWLASGRHFPTTPSDLSILELVNRFNQHANDYYKGADGAPTNEPHNIRLAIRPLLQLYPEVLAADFGPLKLKAVRERMIELGWVRSQINKHVGRIKRMFRWSTENEMVPSSVYHALTAVSGLRYGRSQATESKPVGPVADEIVDATIKFMSRTTAAMVQFQRLTGARAGEVCSLRMCDLDMSGKVWVYTPARHKTQHFGRSRVVFIGPKAQQILRPFLRTDLGCCPFSPALADRERRDRQHARRVTPLSCGNVPGSNLKAHPKKKPGDRYSVNGYNRAIAKGCLKAFPAPETLDASERKTWIREHKWSSHQLRHSFATRVRREHGLDTVQVLLGHAQANVTQVYAEADALKATAAILRIG